MSDGCGMRSRMLMEQGGLIKNTNFECYTDVILSREDLLSSFRRTNKYSILKVENLWRSEIVTRNSSEDDINKCFEMFRQLHYEVAGRRTRGIKTWKIQKEAVKKTNDFVGMLYNDEKQLIGASLFSTSAKACI